jgi:hypothetical protein
VFASTERAFTKLQRPQKTRSYHLGDSQPHALLRPFSGESISLKYRAFVHGRRIIGKSTRILRTTNVSYCCEDCNLIVAFKTRLQVVRHHLLFHHLLFNSKNAGIILRPLQERRAR